MRTPTTKAFTLIELLIVVAIIAILAAIAVPNFLEAQTRSKVSRVHADMRSVAVALEAYNVDYNRPPQDWQERNRTGKSLGTHTAILGRQITTPVAYMTSLPTDPFTGQGSADQFSAQGTSFWYFYAPAADTYSGGQAVAPALFLTGQKGYTWILESYGPERTRVRPDGSNSQYTIPEIIGWGSPTYGLWVYDPTNGTISPGHIARTNKGIYGGEDYE